MPELPEVEVVRRGAAAHVLHRRIAFVEVMHPRAVRRHVAGAADLAARLRGSTPVAAERRGKFLWLALRAEDGTCEDALLVHLGMSGQLLVQPPDHPPETHLRVRMAFADGGPDLRFVDQRTFGGLCVEPLRAGIGARAVPASVAHIALDPLEPGFDPQACWRALRSRRTGLKRALLDQTLISGVGNIYADEALWRMRLHYARATQTLRRAQALGLFQVVAEVMGEALDAGGTSFDELYVNVNGESGYFARSLHAYGREGLPCHRCGRPIRREAFMNRSSFRCPRCQPQPRQPHF